MKSVFKHIIAFVIPTALIVAVVGTIGIFFETNDDRYITEILAGVITLQPEAHTVYVNYLLSLVLTWLYGITNAVPWYGGLLIVLYWMVYVAIFESALSCAKNKREVLGIIAIITAFFVAHLYLIGQIQYTSVAVFLAVTGYFCSLLHQNEKVGLMLFCTFESFAFLLRAQAMLMILPLGIAVFAGILLVEQNINLKIRIIRFAKLCAVLITIIAVGSLGNAIGYRGEDWGEYQKFNQARTELFDYYGAPSYDEVESILNKYDVTKEEYNAFCRYTILDGNISSACLEELADYASAQQVRLTPGEVLQRMFDKTFRENSWKINNIIVLMWISILIWSIFKGNRKNLLPMSFLFLARTAVWMYLIWGERLPLRISIPLMASETLLLIVLVLKTYLDSDNNGNARHLLILVICIFFCCLGVTGGKQQYRYIKEQHTGQKIYFEGLREIIEYCNENPESTYMIEAESMIYYCGSALETDVYQTRNFIVSGGWFSTAPCISEKNDNYMKGNTEGFHFIISQNEHTMSHPAVTYLSKITKSEPVVVDEIAASHGGIYSVLYFEGRNAMLN